MKKIFIIIIGILVAALVLGAAKDLVIKVAAEGGIKFFTGLKLSMGSFRFGMLNSLVDIKNLRLFNPEGFKDRVMIDMPRIYVDYSWLSLFKGKMHLPEMRIHLKEFTVVKNERGELNLNSLKVVQEQKEKKTPYEKRSVKRSTGKAPEVSIDVLELHIGKVIYKDYSAGPTPTIREFNIDVNERFTNVTDFYSVVSIIVVKSLMNTTIAGLANFDLQDLKGSVSGTLATAQEVTARATVAAQAAAKQTQEVAKQTQEAAKKTQEQVKEAAETLTKVFKNPFDN